MQFLTTFFFALMLTLPSMLVQAQETEEYYKTGELKAEHTYELGKLVAQKKFRRNGNLEYEMKYNAEGDKIETQIEYYSTGEVFRQRNLINGKREGLEIEYYSNGQKKAERNYKNGKKEGSAKGYHINGNVQGEWIFENGEPVRATLFYSTGEKWLLHTDFDEKGMLNGVSKEYNKKGKIMALRYYKNNNMIEREPFISSWHQLKKKIKRWLNSWIASFQH